jgi:20S proteasome subunit beta 5
MNAVLKQLQPPTHHLGDEEQDQHDLAAWGSMGGFGNLGRTGGVRGMEVPRVLDVSETNPLR